MLHYNEHYVLVQYDIFCERFHDGYKACIGRGPRAAGTFGSLPPKIGKDELLEVLDLWQMSDENTAKIKAIVRVRRILKVLIFSGITIHDRAKSPRLKKG